MQPKTWKSEPKRKRKKSRHYTTIDWEDRPDLPIRLYEVTTNTLNATDIRLESICFKLQCSVSFRGSYSHWMVSIPVELMPLSRSPFLFPFQQRDSLISDWHTESCEYFIPFGKVFAFHLYSQPFHHQNVHIHTQSRQLLGVFLLLLCCQL